MEDICKIALALSGRFQKKQQEGIHAELCHLENQTNQLSLTSLNVFPPQIEN